LKGFTKQGKSFYLSADNHQKLNQTIMKKILAITALFVLFSFRANEKTVHLQYTETEINRIWRQLSEVQSAVDNSDLPHTEVKSLLSKLDSVKQSIYIQAFPQLTDTTKQKVSADSTSKKPPVSKRTRGE
jgi:hypothetical protein